MLSFGILQTTTAVIVKEVGSFISLYLCLISNYFWDSLRLKIKKDLSLQKQMRPKL